uniref:C2H2-type domain-containing protein n=1 Tax=Timema cristinae TaxID=61476 RepID=A0A7R9CCY3_TIMCR|nr:unnamed protein product [Timema cristinae]
MVNPPADTHIALHLQCIRALLLTAPQNPVYDVLLYPLPDVLALYCYRALSPTDRLHTPSSITSCTTYGTNIVTQGKLISMETVNKQKIKSETKQNLDYQVKHEPQDEQMDCAETSDYFDTTTQDSVKIEKSLDPSDYTINLNLQPFNGKSPKEEIPNKENVVCVKEEKISLTKDTISNATNLFFHQADKRKIYMPKHPLPKAKLILIKRDLLSEKYRYFNVCGECGKPFKSLTYMNRNLLHCDKCGNWISKRSPISCHTNIPDVRSRFECKDCGKCFAQKSEFISHNSESGKPNLFKCEKCGKRFSEKNNCAPKSSHTRSNKETSHFKCEECGERFRHKSEFRAHILFHRKQRLFKCEECGKRFPQKSALRAHILKHISKQSYTCEDCGENFSSKLNLINHTLDHTKSNPFKCEDCGESFRRKSNLRNHILSHSQQEQSYRQPDHYDIEQTRNTATIQHDFAITDSLDSMVAADRKSGVPSKVKEFYSECLVAILDSSVI